MQHRIITLPEDASSDLAKPVSVLSFGPFVEYMRVRLHEVDSIRKDIYQRILDKFSKYPELEGEVKLEDTGKYKDILDLLYVLLSSVVEDEKKVLWGIAKPVSPAIFYGSDGLYEFMFNMKTGQINEDLFEDMESLEKQKCGMLYSYLLNEFYNFSFEKNHEMIRSVFDKQSELTRHYRINLDTRFVKVTPLAPLPELNLETLQVHLDNESGLDMLQRILPLSLFHFSGFSIITITDATQEHAIEKIKDVLVNGHGNADNRNRTFGQVVRSLKAIAGSNDLEFSILPLFRVNNKLVEDIDAYCHSILFSLGKQQGIMKNFFLPLIEKFISHPKLIFFRDIDLAGPSQQQVSELLKQAGVKSYALMPVYYNNNLVGAFEIYTKKKGLLDERTFTKIEPALALVAQIMQNSVDEFEAKISDTIRDKFTSLQPAVQWKFNQAAWDYMYNSRLEGKPSELQKIEFKQVYPLYGAIDMRNSTIERNKAVLNDLKYQFSLLREIFTFLKEKSGFGLTDEYIFKCNKWLNIFQGILTPNDEIRLNQFLNEEAHPFLQHFRDSNLALAPEINNYFEAIAQGEGKAWQHRRQLEESMQLINNSINNYFDLMNVELQKAYPCYFEKFRTDGVEYDIYIGQSIAPEKQFDLVYLKNLRLWQLTSMAAIAKLSSSLLPKMKVKLETTQLVFIYSNTIDISFRNDERRFDVEGGYNIRYHIIKKRIDKVNIKNSRERLTQPGKIALIYFNQKDADEYVSYINHLQEKNILNDDLEYLDLDELQGVSGLKALRVGVNTSDTTHLQAATLAHPSAVDQS